MLRIIMVIICVISLAFIVSVLRQLKNSKKNLKRDLCYIAVAGLLFILALTMKVRTKKYTTPEDNVYSIATSMIFQGYDVKVKKISSGRSEKLIEKKNLLGRVKYVVYLHPGTYDLLKMLGS